MPSVRRRGPQVPVRSDRAKGRPVLLATLDVPFDQDAVAFAVDSAVELGQPLIIANFVERPPLPLSAMLGYDDLPYPPQMADALAAPAGPAPPRISATFVGPPPLPLSAMLGYDDLPYPPQMADALAAPATLA